MFPFMGMLRRHARQDDEWRKKPKLPRVPMPPPTKVVPDKTKVNERGSVKQKLRRTRNEE